MSLLMELGWEGFLLFGKIELDAKSAGRAPTAIEFEPAMFVIDEGKPQTSVAANSPIPAVGGIGNTRREPTDASERFISDPDYIKIKVVKRVAQMPHEIAATPAGPIPFGRHRVILVAEPPEGIELLRGAKAMGLARVVGCDF